MPARRGHRSPRPATAPLQPISGGFAWWFGRVYVDPINPDHIFVAGVNYAESLNGGLTWTTRSTNVIHADQHGLEFDPLTPGRVYLGNDGGLYVSNENGTAGGLWFKTPRLPVTQFYAMDVSRPGRNARQRRLAGQQLAEVLAERQHRQRRLDPLRRRRRDDEPDRPDERPEVLRLLPERRLPPVLPRHERTGSA